MRLGFRKCDECKGEFRPHRLEMSARESFGLTDSTNLIAPRAAAETLRTPGSDSSRRVQKASEKSVWLPPLGKLPKWPFFSNKFF
jgi:hypothetical protein